jgi:(R)-2-hydroxyacyl-CoA dehydratese activating ATPase
MIVAGCDIGTLTTKVLIMNDESIVSYSIVATEGKPGQAAETALENALSKACLPRKKIKCCVSTGWGMKKANFADRSVGEILCLAKGVGRLFPSVKTIINTGAQANTVILLNDIGKVVDYTENDKCAAGTGKFFGAVADALELNISEIGPLSLTAKKMVNISNQCVVFAESEVVNYVNQGEDVADIIAGINFSVARRLVTQANRIGIRKNVCITGGVAKNIGVVKNLAEMFETEIKEMPEDPQIVAAIGAALIAREKLQ